jgi:4-oxalocrotonate tautomerase
MPVIHVNMMEGRTEEQKSAMAKAITDAVVTTLGAKPEGVRILIHEIGHTGFFVAGETLAQRAARQKANASEAKP